jgi:hypothetical protein
MFWILTPVATEASSPDSPANSSARRPFDSRAHKKASKAQAISVWESAWGQMPNEYSRPKEPSANTEAATVAK